MAIAFNLPSEREASEENFSRLNRLLAELYEVLCNILVSRQPGQEQQRIDRPFSESDIDRPTTSTEAISRTISASSPPLTLNLDFDEDDVFVSPRTDNGNDIFSTRSLEIFGHRSPRTPAGVLLSPRRDRSFTFSLGEKHWKDKGGTETVARDLIGADETDAALPVSTSEQQNPETTSSEASIFSSLMPHKLSGSICTAVLFVVGWKLFSNKR